MKKILFAAVLLGMVGCKSSNISQVTSLGSSFHITCYSGTAVILDTLSEGQPSNESYSDGFYFKDKATGKLVEVTGTCIFRED